MKSLKRYLAIGAMCLAGLFSTPKAEDIDDYYTWRQLSLTGVYTHNDSGHHGRSYLHLMRDGSDALVEFDKNSDKHLRGYLDFKKKHLLGEFKGIYSGNLWHKDSKNKHHGNLINLEHTIINHPWFRNKCRDPYGSPWGW